MVQWITRWLWVATALFLVAPQLIPVGGAWFRAIVALPMAHCLAVWIALAIAFRRPLRELTVARYLYISNTIDESTSVRANEAFSLLRHHYPLVLWPFLLIPLTWLSLLMARA